MAVIAAGRIFRENARDDCVCPAHRRLVNVGQITGALVASIGKRHPRDRKEINLEQGYWLHREYEELAMAWNASSARARLIHFDLAGRYSVKAANAGEMLPRFPAHEHSET